MREAERDAMLLDRTAVLQVVSALRLYRAAVAKLLRNRYSDGECDGYSLHEFQMCCEEAEESLGEEQP